MSITGHVLTVPAIAAGRNSVAFHSAVGLYLMAETGSPVCGRFINASGSPQGERFAIAEESEGFTGWVGVTAGGSPVDPCWLVTYAADSGGTHTKYGRLVRRTGSTQTVSARSTITVIGDEWFASEKAQAVWHATVNKFVIGTRKLVGSANPQPVVHHMNLVGTVTGGNSLGDELDYYGSPALALATNGTCVVCGYAGGIPVPASGGTYIRRFSASTLAAIGSLQYVASHSAPLQEQAVVYSPANSRFVVVWWRDGYVDSRRMGLDGALESPELDLLESNSAGDLALSYNAHLGTILLGTKFTPADYYVLELSPLGEPVNLSNKVLVTPWDGSWPEYTPVIASDPDGKWLVVVRQGSGSKAMLVTSTTGGGGEEQPIASPPDAPDPVTALANILTQSTTFDVVSAPETVVTITLDVKTAFPESGEGYGRIVHPILGAFDYEVKPDEWMNIDRESGPVIPPLWVSARTLTNAANTLWAGNIQDVVVEERWTAQGGIAMPITQLRMLMVIWTNPVDPDVGYVHWYPNYITQQSFRVIPVNLTVGGQGIALDDITNYKDEDGEPIGWVTGQVVFQLKIVGIL